MVKKSVIIKNPLGLHLRSAGVFCKKAMIYNSYIIFNYKGQTYNAKSVLSVLSASIKNEDEIEIICDGRDEEEALKALVKFVNEELCLIG